MNSYIEFVVNLGLLSLYGLLAAACLGVALLTYLFVRHGFWMLRARRRHARYVPKYYRKRGLIPAPNRTDIVARG